MGSEAGQDNERPVHRVELDAFAIGVAQVTNAEFDLFVQRTGRSPLAHRESRSSTIRASRRRFPG
jgi:formylglycine-generating enzyme required for sulfatase activity